MIKVLIVDENDSARKKLKRLIAGVNDELRVLEARSDQEALELIRSFLPDIIFLETEISGKTAFEILAQTANRRFELVFFTSSELHAIGAFEVGALDYLVKPIMKKRFKLTWERFIKRYTGEPPSGDKDLSFEELQKFSVKVGNNLRIIAIEDILYFRSIDRFVRLYLESGNYSCNMSLDYLESKLGKGFIRVHRSNLVNIDHVESVLLETNVTQIRMTNGEIINVSRAKRQLVKSMFA